MPGNQFAEKPELPPAGQGSGRASPKRRRRLPGPCSLLLPSSRGRTWGAAPPLLQRKVKWVDLRLGPKTRSNKRYKKESWLAHLVNSDFRGQLLPCRSCPAESATETLEGFVQDTTCSAFWVVLIKREDRVTAALLKDLSFC